MYSALAKHISFLCVYLFGLNQFDIFLIGFPYLNEEQRKNFSQRDSKLSSYAQKHWLKYDEASVILGTVNAELWQELLGCVSTLQPFCGFGEMRGTGSQVDLELETEDDDANKVFTPVGESQFSEGEPCGTEE